MMRYLYILIFSLSGLGLTMAQDTIVVKIKGHSTSKGEDFPLVVRIKFEENQTTCGPNSEYESIEEQIGFFEGEIVKNKMDLKSFTELSLLSDMKARNKTKSFHMKVKNIKEAKQVFSIAKLSFAQSVELYGENKEINFRDQDEQALDAFSLTYDKAKILANILHKDIIEVVNIDDLTSGTLSQFSAIPFNSKYRKLSAGNLVRKSKYSLNVTYKLY